MAKPQITVVVPPGLTLAGGSPCILLSGRGMMIQICPASENTKPNIAHDEGELQKLQENLIATGESPGSAELIANTVHALRKKGKLTVKQVAYGDVSGVKYEFLDAVSNTGIIHFVLRVPGGHVTVVASSPISSTDGSLVESFLHSIRIQTD